MKGYFVRTHGKFRQRCFMEVSIACMSRNEALQKGPIPYRATELSSA